MISIKPTTATVTATATATTTLLSLLLLILPFPFSSLHHVSAQKISNGHTPGFDQTAARIMQQSASSLLSTSSSSSSSSSRGRGHRGLQDNINNIDKKTQPLRIHFFTDPIEQSINESTIPSHQEGGRNVLNNILPSVQSQFESIIKVEPTPELVIPSNICTTIFQDYFPSSNGLYGVEDVDLIIIVSSFEQVVDPNTQEVIEWCDSGGNVLASATYCGQDKNTYRPLVGYMNICLGATAKQTNESMEEIVSHELLHVLIMNEYLFPWYTSAINGGLLSPDVLTTTPTEFVKCVNGVPDRNWYKVSTNVLQYKTESNRRRGYYEIQLPTVRQVVKNQFNCPSATGARLENQPTSEASCFGSHLDERFFQYHMMSAIYDSTSSHFTPLILAFMEDSGWYNVDYRLGENSPFGLQAGCDFLNKDCITNGELPSYSEGNFCNTVFPTTDDNEDLTYSCDPGHHYRGVCDLFNYASWETDLEKPERQYFTNSFVGPAYNTRSDWCPTVFKHLGDASTECSNVNNDLKIDEDVEAYGDNSRCMDVSINGKSRTALCINAVCDNDAKKFVFDVDGTSYSCSYGEDSMVKEVMGHGKTLRFTCPKLTQACPDMFCPSMCSGKGICDWNATPMPVCNCFSADDKTAGCFDSPPNNPNAASSTTQHISLLIFSISVVVSYLTFF